MSGPSSITRRQLLGLLSAAGIGGLAGCGGEEKPLTTSSTGTITSPAGSLTTNPTTVSPTEKAVVELPWEQLPGPPGGPVTDIAISRADPVWMYATTITAGVFASSSSGSDWIQGKSGMHHQNQLWASPYSPQLAYTQGARTPDGGFHWYQKGSPKRRLPPVAGISHLEWDPFDENRMYATAPPEGFFRTFDDGRNWEQRPVITSTSKVDYVDVHPNEEGVLIAGVPKEGVAKSTDYGESWSLIPGSEDIPNDPFWAGLSLGNLDKDEQYLAINGSGVYRVLNGKLTKLTENMAMPWWSNQLRLSADRGELYFIGALETDDGHKGWWDRRKLFVMDTSTDEISTIQPPEKPSAMATHPFHPDTIFVGGTRWVFASDDRGESWTDLSKDFIDGYLATVEVNPSQPETVIPGSTCSSGISVSRDHGHTFEWKRSGLIPWHGGKFGEHYVKQIRALQDHIYATTGSGLLISRDNGATWELLDNRFSGQGGRAPREPFTPLSGLAVHPTDPEVVIVGSGRTVPGNLVIDETLIWKSTDGGENWQEISTGFPTEALTIVRDILFSPDDAELVYAATIAESVLGGEGNAGVGVGIYKSENGGGEWEALETPFENVHTLSIAPVNPAVLYASTPEGVYRSVNRGTDWENILEYETRALLAHPNETGVVFAGANKYEKYWDLLVTVDDGESWAEGNLTIQIGREANEREYDAIDIHSDYWNERGEIEWFAFDQSNSLIYAATRGAGLWRAATDILE